MQNTEMQGKKMEEYILEDEISFIYTASLFTVHAFAVLSQGT